MPKVYKEAKTEKWGINCLVKRPDGTYAHINRRGYPCRKSAEDDMRRLAKRISQDSKNDSGNKQERSFGALIESYLRYKSTKVRLSSLEGAERLIRTHIAPRLSERKATAVFEAKSLEAFRDGVSKLGVRAERKNRILSRMREIASFAFENGWVSPEGYRNSKVCLAAFGNDSFEVAREKRALTPEEYRKFIATFRDGDRYKVLFEVFFYLGARCGEMEGLQWKDVDPTAKEVFIHQQNEYFASKGKWVLSPTKTKASQRHIRLSPFICAELDDLRKTYGQSEENFLFFGPKAITKHPIVEQLRRHCLAASVPVISPHEIRHTVASWLVGNCKDMSDLIVVQRWLGHSSLKETLDTYSHYLKSGPGVASVLSKIQG